MERRARILLVYPLLDPRYHRLLERLGELDFCETDAATEISARLVDADAVLLRGPARLSADQIYSAPNLRVIGAAGAGVDNIDLEAATDAGIPVLYGSGVSPASVAEYVLGAIVVSNRGLPLLHDALLRGELAWAGRLEKGQGREVAGTVLGIVGYGSIGREVARRAVSGLGMEVVVFDRHLDQGANDGTARSLGSLAELLSASDTVSLHVPGGARNMDMIGAAEIDLIGPDGVLINTSRGGVVNEPALVRALRSGRLRGAVLDVLAQEPPSSGQLAQLRGAPNLLLTPHVAGVTDLAAERLSAALVAGVAAVLAGRPLVGLANPDVLEATRILR